MSKLKTKSIYGRKLNNEYIGINTREEDFETFWNYYINKVNEHSAFITLENTHYQYCSKEVKKIGFRGLDGTIIYGWYIYDVSHKNRQVLMTTHGYRSSKGVPNTYLHWLDINYDVIVIDMRLQGGETACKTPIQAPFFGEVISVNIMDITNSYLLMIYTDMMIATRVAKQLGYEDYVLQGTSQAGGIAVAVGCLMNDAKAVLANVPSCSDLDQRILEGKGSFKSFQKLASQCPECSDLIMKNVSYFDTKNMAYRLMSPLFASVASNDEVCPERAFYATYNRVKSDKKINVYPYNGHEGGSSYQTELEMAYLLSLIKTK